MAEAIPFAHRSGIAVTARSGGHDFAGRSSGPGIVLDLRGMDSLEVADGLATVGAGFRLGDLYAALASHEVTIPGGCGATVGIGGQALGGGLGLLGRSRGLTSDQVVAAQVVLADEATRLCHGEAARATAAETARRTFAEGATGEDLPTVEVQRAELAAGIPAFDLFRRAGLAVSNGEARRLIKGGGARLNNAPVTDEMQAVTIADLDEEGLLKLSAGKKRHALVRAA